MQIFYQKKAIGQKARRLQKVPLQLTQPVHTLQELLEEIVRLQVQEYNSKATEEPLFIYLTEGQLRAAAHHGKIGFGEERKNEKQQSVKKAIETMFQAFEDELFLVIHNETELKSLQAPITVKEDDVFTFIKLTMLAGRIW